MESSFEITKDWLLNSGIFVSDSSDPNYGAVHSFYDEKSKEFAFLYPEITGYFASTMRFLYEHEKNEKYVNFAKASCNWLIDLYEKFGGIIQGISIHGIPQKLVYSFDTGMCAKGFLDCYIITKEQKFLNYGQQLCNWLIDETMDSEGFVKPLKNLQSNKFEESPNVWYKQSGCLHIKLAIPLLQLYQINNDKKLFDSAQQICDTISYYHNDDGSLRLHKNDKTINLHTLCYTLEGLLYAFVITKNTKYLEYCKNALQWCDSKISSDGSIELWFNSKYHEKASYPIAQIIRLRILISKIIGKSINQNQDLLINFLHSLHSRSNELTTNGGFYEEFYKSILGWKKRYKINSWGSMFGLQALYWHENYDNIDVTKEIELLY